MQKGNLLNKLSVIILINTLTISLYFAAPSSNIYSIIGFVKNRASVSTNTCYLSNQKICNSSRPYSVPNQFNGNYFASWGSDSIFNSIGFGFSGEVVLKNLYLNKYSHNFLDIAAWTFNFTREFHNHLSSSSAIESSMPPYYFNLWARLGAMISYNLPNIRLGLGPHLALYSIQNNTKNGTHGTFGTLSNVNHYKLGYGLQITAYLYPFANPAYSNIGIGATSVCSTNKTYESYTDGHLYKTQMINCDTLIGFTAKS